MMIEMFLIHYVKMVENQSRSDHKRQAWTKCQGINASGVNLIIFQYATNSKTITLLYMDLSQGRGFCVPLFSDQNSTQVLDVHRYILLYVCCSHLVMTAYPLIHHNNYVRRFENGALCIFLDFELEVLCKSMVDELSVALSSSHSQDTLKL